MNVEGQKTAGPLAANDRARGAIWRSGSRHALVERARNAFARHPFMAAALVFSIVSAFYWVLVASDRFVSEAQVIVEKTDLRASNVPDLGSLIGGGGAGNRSDQLVMREYLLSRDMVDKLDRELGLRKHYSSWGIDPFSRLSFANSKADFYDYFMHRITVEFDDYSGVLVVQAQAFDPEMAQRITSMMITDGGDFMNATANSLASEQVEFLRGEVASLEDRAREARQKLIGYQNRERIASPESQAETITGIIGELEGRRSELQVQLASQSAFLVDDHPVLVELRRQIAAIDRQIAQQNARLTNPGGGSLNAKMEQFAILEADAKFAEELYRTALAALEKGQVESTRTIKTLAIVQKPNVPDEAELPDRVRNSIVYALFAFLIAGVLQLLVMIIRDHRD